MDDIFDRFLVDPIQVAERDRGIFARAYDSVESIRAGNGWFQAFDQDIADFRTYGKVDVPVLGLASPANFPTLRDVWPAQGTDVRMVKIDNSGHFLADDQPEAVAQRLIDFFG
ncbi:hypothetical protein GCM10029964_065730 [Kibdelosporangium lantanae]